MAVNGAYTNGQSYDVAEQNHEAYSTNHSTSVRTEYAPTNVSSTSANAPDISKEEVGWYFVEKYYTALSQSPDTLHLFYAKSSQFVTGVEAEKVDVCVGQKAISDKIRELDIQDCKVRVTNVDSQGSKSNIVIQVIGEISNKAQPQRKFTQTFVLAEQTQGYFVLNDIFRYILDEDEYEAEGEDHQQIAQVDAAAGEYQETASTAQAAHPEGLTNSEDPAARERDAAVVDRSLEQVAQEEPKGMTEPENGLNGDMAAPVADVAIAEDTPVAAADTADELTTTSEAIEAAPMAEPAQEEKPQAPEPTPAASPPKQTPSQPSAPAKPAVPRSWASLVGSSNSRVAPAVPTAPAPSATKSTPAPTTQAAAATPTGPAAYTASSSEVQPPASSGSEWQTAGPDHKRQQSRTQAQQQVPDSTRGYIKNVTDQIDDQSLKDALAKAAKVSYIDISRPKKCAFLEFATLADYTAAMAANPYEVNGVRLFVEERRVRPYGAPGFAPGRGGPMRGGGPPRGGRGRGNFRGGRGGAGAPPAA